MLRFTSPLKPLVTNFLTFWQPFLPCSEWFSFNTRCHYSEQIVTDMRKVIGPIISVHGLVFFFSCSLYLWQACLCQEGVFCGLLKQFLPGRCNVKTPVRLGFTVWNVACLLEVFTVLKFINTCYIPLYLSDFTYQSVCVWSAFWQRMSLNKYRNVDDLFVFQPAGSKHWCKPWIFSRT